LCATDQLIVRLAPQTGQINVCPAGSGCRYVVQPFVVQYSRWLAALRRIRRRADA
jgi:hypothetical protein